MMEVGRGQAYPLGPSILYQSSFSDGSIQLRVNLSVFAKVDRISVCLFPPLFENSTVIRDPSQEIVFSARTGDVWHIELNNVPKNAAYAYRVHKEGSVGQIFLLDPYSKWVQSRGSQSWMQAEGEKRGSSTSFNLRSNVQSFLSSFPRLRDMGIHSPFRLSRFCAPEESERFDWENERAPKVSYDDLVIYEAHVRGLSPEGTFEAAIERISYWKWLGITAVQLMPIFEFSELERGAFDGDYALLSEKNPSRRKGNIWGYSPMSWFSPMNRFSSQHCDGGAVGLKKLVKALHDKGIECILDVVYNHTSNSSCPFHVLGVQSAYYIGERHQQHFKHSNISGCGNTLSPNTPLMHQLILDSMRWFVTEYHIDGFRIDAAGVLCRDEKGNPMRYPPILNHITKDPILRDTKFIVEGWDAGDGIGSPNFLLGSKHGFPYGEHFCEWNAEWRDSVRKFVRGDRGSTEAVRKGLQGSQHLFPNPKKASCRGLTGANRSLNFVACHDGFSMKDVVSYNKRTNEDGYDEISFNCGINGDTGNSKVIEERCRCLRFFIFLLAVSRGVPMINQGDEIGFSKLGNNNTWNDPMFFSCQLPEKPWECNQSQSLTLFVKFMLKQRRLLSCLRGSDFFDNLIWLDANGRNLGISKKKDHGQSRFIAFVVVTADSKQTVYISCNGSDQSVDAHLPLDSPFCKLRWVQKVDTSSGEWNRDSPGQRSLKVIHVMSRSCVLLVGYQ